jgi:hypothetical protein
MTWRDPATATAEFTNLDDGCGQRSHPDGSANGPRLQDQRQSFACYKRQTSAVNLCVDVEPESPAAAAEKNGEVVVVAAERNTGRRRRSLTWYLRVVIRDR